MKQSIARQHSRPRDFTPTALRLPPPKPPTAAKRALAVVPDAAIALPDAPEPLVERTPAPRPLNRQARRKAMRAEAKALRREGQPVVAAPPPVAAPKAGRAAVPADAIPTATVVAATGHDTPLPRSRALTTAKPRGLALFSRRLRALFSLKQAYVTPAKPIPPEPPMVAQLRRVRADLAALQQSLDRMIDAAS